MKNQPAHETYHGLALQPGKEILSILLRPDGLSFAYSEQGEVRTDAILFPSKNPEAGLDFALSATEWPNLAFSEVQVCVPTNRAILIPAELNRPEKYNQIICSSGYAEDPGIRILGLPCPGNLILLHGVRETVLTPLLNKYGDKVSFFHPVYVNLCQPEKKNTTLYVDSAADYGNFTLKYGKELIFADVFPLENDASLLLCVNRIVVTNKIGAVQIVCSGDNCESNKALLDRYFRNVSVHPQGELRNLLFPLTCE